MKTYSIVVTVVAVLAILSTGYFYFSGNSGGLKQQLESCQKDKTQVESQLSQSNEQLNKISKTVAALKSINESFMIPGDSKVIGIGSKEAAEVEQTISDIADKTDRIMAESDWNNFKNSLKLNSLFRLYRDLADNLERVLEQPINVQAQ